MFAVGIMDNRGRARYCIKFFEEKDAISIGHMYCRYVLLDLMAREVLLFRRRGQVVRVSIAVSFISCRVTISILYTRGVFSTYLSYLAESRLYALERSQDTGTCTITSV